MVLTRASSSVVVPGVMKLIFGARELYWWFCDISTVLPPNALSSVKQSKELPTLWFRGSKVDLSTSR